MRKDCNLHAYGAKVVSWLQPPNDPALNSRCVLISMFESKSTSLVPTDDPKVQQLAVHLQGSCSDFGFRTLKKYGRLPFLETKSFDPVHEISFGLLQRLTPRTRSVRSACCNSSHPAKGSRPNR